MDLLEFKKDAAGYCVDIDGNQVMTDCGPMPGHWARRCVGVTRSGQRGEYERCNYRWTFRPCPHCEAENDIAARYCIAVEDSPRGINAARAAGLECVLFTPGGVGADRDVGEVFARAGSAEELEEVLRKWIRK